MSARPLIGIVGPCKAGKSTLAENLAQHGHSARQIAQEHSFAPHMWQSMANPDLLIFLDVDYETTTERGLTWLPADYAEQQQRLAHARQHANLVVKTDKDSPQQVLARVLKFLDQQAKLQPKE